MSAPAPAESLGSELKERATAGAAWIGLGRATLYGLQFATSIVLARMLGPRDFGLLGLASLYLLFLSAFADFGVRSFVIQHKELPAPLESAAWRVNAALGVSLALLTLAAAGPAATFLNEPAVAPILRAYSALYLVGGLTAVQGALLTRRLDFRRAALAEMLGGAVYCALAVGLALSGVGLWSVVWARIASLVLSAAYVLRHTYWLGGRVRPEPGDLSAVARFGLPVVGAGLTAQLYENVDNFFVGRVLGAQALGYYGLAYNLVALPHRVLGYMLAGISFPLMSRARAEEGLFEKAYLRTLRYAVVLILPIHTILAALAQPFVALAYGDAWLPAAPLVTALCLAGAALALETQVAAALTAVGAVRAQLGYQLAKVAVVGGAVAAAVYLDGRPTTIALTYSGANAFMLCGGLAISTSLGKVQIRRVWSTLAPSGAALVACLGAALGARGLLETRGPLLELSVGAGAALAAYAFALRLFCPDAFADVAQRARGVLATWAGRRV